MKDAQLLREYYKRKLYGDRRRLARAVDFLALRALGLLGLYFWFAGRLESSFLRWCLSAVVLGLACVAAELYKSIRLERFREKERAQIRQTQALEQLMLLPGARFASAVHAYAHARPEAYGGYLICPLQRCEPVGADTLCRIYRLARRKGCERVALFCPGEMGKEAERLMKRTDIPIKQADMDAFVCIAASLGLVPDEAAVDARILAELKAEREQKKKAAPLAPGRIRRYLLVAAGLLAASFFARYALYYRLMAGVCLSLGCLSWWLERTAPQQRL